MRAPAEPTSLPALRGRVDRWLRALDWPEDEREDVVLAVSEACANAIDHAYPAGSGGEVGLRGRVVVRGALRRVVVEVSDHGSWRPEPTDPGTRGHGLRVMRACLDRVEIRTTGSGTTVEMTGRAVPQRRVQARERALRGAGTRATTSVAIDVRTAERRHREHLVGRRSARLCDEAAARVERARAVFDRAGAIAQHSARLRERSRRLRAER